MSEKQDFNKGAYIRQIAEKRRERWMSRKLLTEILEVVRKKRDDANWILYQILKNDSKNLTYKSKIKIWNWLMREAYDVLDLRPEKPQKTKITLKLDAPIVPNFDENFTPEKYLGIKDTTVKNAKQLDEANFVIKKYIEEHSGQYKDTEVLEDYLNRWKIDYQKGWGTYTWSKN